MNYEKEILSLIDKVRTFDEQYAAQAADKLNFFESEKNIYYLYMDLKSYVLDHEKKTERTFKFKHPLMSPLVKQF
ncbi:hypothetical protein BSZ54_14235 [Listeria monocytogenes]|nr:hypothetical protein [Listeria monocytogenes]